MPHFVYSPSTGRVTNSLVPTLLGLMALLGCATTPDSAELEVPETSQAQPRPNLDLEERDPGRLRDDLYARALELEAQGLETEAIATYTEVLVEFGDFADAEERRQRLADALGMSLPELLIPERPRDASTRALELPSEGASQTMEPRLPPNPDALESESLWFEMYERGRRYERAHGYRAAIDVYTELLDRRGSYKDAALRRTTLVKLERLAEKLYARGLAAETDEQALENFEQIEVFWPEFRDIAELLESLRDL